ncbi:MAG TPA: pitrilysin family protein [Anaerolineales bacterium]
MNSASTKYAFPGPEDVTRAKLSNGIVVLARANFNSPSVVVSGYLPVGNLFDPDEKLGLAGFTASALMRGTTLRSFREIYDALESVGASMGFNGGTHSTGFGGRSLVEDLDLLLEMLNETIRRPTFPSEQMERLRAQILTGLAIQAQDTGEMASLAFDEIVYSGHPYSRREDGYPETVQAVTREDLEAFHSRHFGPQGMVIAVVGAVEPEQAVDKVAQTLGDWKNPRQPDSPDLPSVTPLNDIVTRHVTIPGKFQADLVMGAAGPERRSPDYLAAALGNSVLGQFGMMGRIGDAVREKAGLAYYAYSTLGGGMGPGPWYVSAGIDPGKVEQTVVLVSQEIGQFIAEPVSSEELSDSQANFIGRLPLSLESNGGVAAALLNLERYQLGLDYYYRYADLIRAITPEEVLETARRYLHPERLAIATAGP